ncbi:class I SAM-dependent methyltransferase [Rheinheimera gaetbuli]
MIELGNNSAANQLFNLHSAASQEDVDKINKRFYGRFNFPWHPAILSKYKEQMLWTTALNQEVGVFDNSRIGESPRIWVAGCGTNQAVITALKYPQSEILGTDISTESLAAAKVLAEQLNVTNVKLEEMSLNNVNYEDEFDIVICTGVIHHNYDPSIPLSKLAKALKKNGVLELFVYNYYHRLTTTAFQKAIRMMCSTDGRPEIDVELPVSAAMIKDQQANYSPLMGGFLAGLVDSHESAMADAILQPVEYSYTVETFNELIQSQGLEIITPCINQWDKGEGRISWEMKFSDKRVEDQYMSLPDLTRWQIGNLLLLENSPHVWFYVQRKDSSFPVQTSNQINEVFLQTHFKKMRTSYDLYVYQEDSSYKLTEEHKVQPDPIFPKHKLAARVFERCTGEKTMANILKELKVEADFHLVNELRLRLTTPAFPYICAAE